MEKEKYLPFNLQFFGDGEGSSTEEQDTSTENKEETKEKENVENTEKEETKEDELEKLKKQFAETEKKHKEDIKNAVDKAIKEEKRLSKLSQEERENEEKLQKLKDLEEREKTLIFKEKLSDVKDELIKRKLPTTFAEFLVDEDNSKSLEKISEFEKNFREAVQNEVNSKIKGVNLKSGTNDSVSLGKEIAQKVNSQQAVDNNPWA